MKEFLHAKEPRKVFCLVNNHILPPKSCSRMQSHFQLPKQLIIIRTYQGLLYSVKGARLCVQFWRVLQRYLWHCILPMEWLIPKLIHLFWSWGQSRFQHYGYSKSKKWLHITNLQGNFIKYSITHNTKIQVKRMLPARTG